MTSKRRYVVHSTSPPTTSDSGSASSEDDTSISDLKKKRKCTRKNKPNYNESNTKAHFRESYVFSTTLANLAASAVKHRMCDTIIIYHQGIPRDPNKLTIKPPKVTSKLLATSSVRNRKSEKQEKKSREAAAAAAELAKTRKTTQRATAKSPKPEVEAPCPKAASNGRSPLTPPRSPKLPQISGDYTLSVSERIKCRSRACAPKFYGEDKDQEAPPVRESSRDSSRDSSRRKSAEKSKRQSNERQLRLMTRRDSIESDGEKIRNILENSKPLPSPVNVKPEAEDKQEKAEDKQEKAEDKQVNAVDKQENAVDRQEKAEESKVAKEEDAPIPKVAKVDKRIMSPKREAKPRQSPKIAKPSPVKGEKVRPRLSDTSTDSLFEAAFSQKVKSPRLKKQVSSETKTAEKTETKVETKQEAPPDTTPKFKPVKQSSPVKDTAPPAPPESAADPNMPKFKPLPFSGNPKKSRSFKFRTTQGAKHDMNLVDSIFSSDNPPELSPLNTKPPTTPPCNSKIPVTKLADKPPRPELVMGIPNLQGPSKPPMLTPAHNTVLQHSSIQHIMRTGPPPLSSPKITVTTKAPPSSTNVAPKRPSAENYPEQRKKRRFVFPSDDPAAPAKVTSPSSPVSPPITLKGPGSTRVSPISPQTNVDNVLANPILRNGLPLHKPSPKNSPRRATPLDSRLELLAEFSGRRSPLVKVNNTSPITPKASPSTVGQFYQPNVSLNSCSRGDIQLTESVLEHSKLAGGQHNRAPVVTINHQTIQLEQQDRGKDQAPKPRITVDNDAYSKKQQQEIFARQQLFSRAFSPYSFPNPIPTTAASKLNKQFELTQQLKQQDLGSLVDLYGGREKEAAQPAFPTHLRQPLRGSIQRQSNSPRSLPTEVIVQQERERLLSQQQERLLAQQRQHATREQGPLFNQRQETLLHRAPSGNTSQHLPYSSGVLNQIGYPIGLNQQLYKQLASDPTQVTSASILQSLAGYHQQLQLAAAAAGKFGPLAHLYHQTHHQANSKQSSESKTPNQFGVIRP